MALPLLLGRVGQPKWIRGPGLWIQGVHEFQQVFTGSESGISLRIIHPSARWVGELGQLVVMRRRRRRQTKYKRQVCQGGAFMLWKLLPDLCQPFASI